MASPSVSVRMIELARVRAIVLRSALFTTLGVFAVLVPLDAGLHGPHAPQGIVSFELAGSHAVSVLEAWSEAQRRDALLVQGLDYLFLAGYSTLLAAVALTLSARLGQRAPLLRRLTPLAVWAAMLAGAADVVENVPLIMMLRTGVASPAGATVALVCATIKFALVLAVVLFLLCARLAMGRSEH